MTKKSFAPFHDFIQTEPGPVRSLKGEIKLLSLWVTCITAKLTWEVSGHQHRCKNSSLEKHIYQHYKELCCVCVCLYVCTHICLFFLSTLTLSFLLALNLRRHSTVSWRCIMEATVERCCVYTTGNNIIHNPNFNALYCSVHGEAFTPKYSILNNKESIIYPISTPPSTILLF